MLTFRKVRKGNYETIPSDNPHYSIHQSYDGVWTAYRNGRAQHASTLKAAKELCNNHANGDDLLFDG